MRSTTFGSEQVTGPGAVECTEVRLPHAVDPKHDKIGVAPGGYLGMTITSIMPNPTPSKFSNAFPMIEPVGKSSKPPTI